MRRFTTSVILGLLALLILAFPVDASVGWCRRDPIVRLGGTEVQILVAIPESYLPLVTGPIDVAVGTSTRVAQQVVMTDAGFNNFGEKVSFFALENGTAGDVFAARIVVRVPVDETQLWEGQNIPVEVTVIPANGDAVAVYGSHKATTVDILIARTGSGN